MASKVRQKSLFVQFPLALLESRSWIEMLDENPINAHLFLRCVSLAKFYSPSVGEVVDSTDKIVGADDLAFYTRSSKDICLAFLNCAVKHGFLRFENGSYFVEFWDELTALPCETREARNERKRRSRDRRKEASRILSESSGENVTGASVTCHNLTVTRHSETCDESSPGPSSPAKSGSVDNVTVVPVTCHNATVTCHTAEAEAEVKAEVEVKAETESRKQSKRKASPTEPDPPTEDFDPRRVYGPESAHCLLPSAFCDKRFFWGDNFADPVLISFLRSLRAVLDPSAYRTRDIKSDLKRLKRACEADSRYDLKFSDYIMSIEFAVDSVAYKRSCGSKINRPWVYALKVADEVLESVAQMRYGNTSFLDEKTFCPIGFQGPRVTQGVLRTALLEAEGGTGGGDDGDDG